MGKKQAKKRAAKRAAKTATKRLKKQYGLKTTLKYDITVPFAMRDKISEPDSKREFLQEYTRLRDIAQKRLKRLGADELGKQTEAYKEHAKGFKKLRDIKTDEELRASMADIARFLSDKYGTVTGAKNLYGEVYQNMRKKYNFLNARNFTLFLNVMDYAKSLYKGREFDSDFVVRQFQKMDAQNYNKTQMLRVLTAYASKGGSE